jgi:phage/plasmid-like protein (TIGR03299 family)
MPAYFDSGFSVREPMWHGGGNVLTDYPTDWTDARKKAGLEWEPELVPCYTHKTFEASTPITDLEQGAIALHPGAMADEDGNMVTASTEWMVPLVDHKLVERDDTHGVLGVVSDRFGLVYHSVMGEILEAILGQPNVKFETAGSCRDGAQVWALAYIDEPYKVVGDNTETMPFVALLNNHDGSGACKLVRTQVRVVCWNTYQAAEMEGERTGQQFAFRHSGDVQGRITEAIAALSGARNEAKDWQEMAAELFGQRVDEACFNRYLADFIPDPIGEVVSDRVRGNVERARSTFRSLYFDSVTTEAHRGTALGLVDASVEWLDHVRGFRNRDTYMGRTLLRPEPMKARAVKLVRQAVGA